MRVHTKLTVAQLDEALKEAAGKGLVPVHLMLLKADEHRSRSRAKAYEVQLGTFYKEKGDGRRYRNSGYYGADTGSAYAAKWDEWGYFFAEVFKLDPEALVPVYYDGEKDFHERTKQAYATP